MFEKIDKRLLEKIKMQKFSDESLECIIMSNEYLTTKERLQKLCKNYVELPLISGFAIECDVSNLFRIARLNCVKFVASNAHVNSLVYASKKFLNTDALEKYSLSNIRHSVVIIDTGIYPHMDFCLGRNRIIKFIDLINQSNSPYDDNGHGTFVSGIFAGGGIVDKYAGFDTNCDIIVIKALDDDGETTSIRILQAMQWIIDNYQKYNIKVVCMSFGSIYDYGNDPLIFGVEVLWNSGITVVCAGGNSGPESGTIMSPGASKKVITVGSLDSIDDGISVADFSSRGPVYNYYKPDLVVPGVDIISTNVFDKNKMFYTKMSGTSVSTPMVAGVASMLLNINPKFSPDQIKYMLIKSCTKITGDKNKEGYGYLDLNKLRLL